MEDECLRRAGCQCPDCSSAVAFTSTLSSIARTPMRNSIGGSGSVDSHGDEASAQGLPASFLKEEVEEPAPEKVAARSRPVKGSALKSASGADENTPAEPAESKKSGQAPGKASSTAPWKEKKKPVKRKDGESAGDEAAAVEIHNSPLKDVPSSAPAADVMNTGGPKECTPSQTLPLTSVDGASISEERPLAGRGGANYDLSALKGNSENSTLKWGMSQQEDKAPIMETAAPTVAEAEAPSGAPAAPFGERWASKSASARRGAIMELATALRAPGCPLTAAQSSVLTASAVLSAVMDGTQLIAEAGVHLAAAVVSPAAMASSHCAFLKDEANAKELVKALVSKALSSSKTPIGDAAVDSICGCITLCSTGVACAGDELAGALRAMAKPKAVRNAARILTRVIESKQLRPCLKAESMVNALPTILLCADKAVSGAGVDLARALAGAPGPYGKAVAEMVKEYTTGAKAGGFSPELAGSIMEAAAAAAAAAQAEGGAAAGSGGEGGEAGKAPGAAAGAAAPSDPVEAEWAELDAAVAWSEGPKDLSKAILALHLDERLAPNAENKDTKEKLKWNDRVKAIDELLALLAKHPRVSGESHSYGDAISGLRKALKDTNAAVVAKAIAGLAALGMRMRGNFGSGAKGALSDVAARLREKRGAPQTAALSCLRSFVRYDSVSLEDVIGVVPPGEEGWKKAPAEYRRNMLQMAVTMLLPTGTGLPKAQPLTGTSPSTATRMKSLGSLIAAGLGDASPDVKMEAERLLAVAMHRVGPAHSVLAPLLDQLEKDSKAGADRVRSMAEGNTPFQAPVAPPSSLGATVALGATSSAGVPAAEAGKAPAAPGARGRPATASGSAAGRSVSRAHSAAPKAGGKPGTAPAASGKAGSLADSAYEASIAEEPGCLPDAEDAAASLLAAGLPGYGPAEHALHESAKWQDRKAAVEALVAGVCGARGGPGPHVEAVVSLLSNKTSGFKPAGGLNNAALLTSVANAVEKVALGCTSPSHFTRRAARVVLDGLLPYLKEKKGAEEVGRMAVSLAPTCGPNFVAARLAAAGASDKATPGIMAAVNERLAGLIETYGVGRLSAMHVLPHLTGPAGVQASAMPVKAPAIKALMALHAQMGPPLETAVLAKSKSPPTNAAEPSNKWGIPDNQEKSLKEQFAKNGYEASKARALLEGTKPVLGESAPPAVRVHGEAAPAGAAGEATAESAFAMEASEREDVLSLLPATCMSDMECEVIKAADGGAGKAGDTGDKPWQIRMRGVEAVVSALTEAAKTAPGAAVLVNDNTTALLKVLKKRLADTQANVKPRACNAIATLARCAGPSLAPTACRTVVGPLLEMLGDKKGGLKEAALSALDAIVGIIMAEGVAVAGETSTPAANAAPCHTPALIAVLNVVNTSGVLGGGSGGLPGAMGGTLGGGGLGATMAGAGGDRGGTGVGVTGGIREALVPWMARHMPSLPKGSAGVLPVAAGLVPTILDCAMDRLPQVRKSAQEVLTHLARLAGAQPLQSALNTLREAQRLTLTKIVEECVAQGKALNAAAAAGASAGKAGAPAAEVQAEDDIEPAAAAAVMPAGKTLGATTMAAAAGKTVKAGTLQAPSKSGKGVGTGTTKLGSTTAAGAMVAAGGGEADPNGYALLKTAPAGKKAREKETSAKTWEVRTSGEGSSDLGKEVDRLGKVLKGEMDKAKLVSDKLLANLFPRVDNGPNSLKGGLDWISNALHTALDTSSRSPSAMSTLEAARDGCDMLLKLAAWTMYDPKCRTVLMAAAARLLDAVLTCCERLGWGLTRYEGDILVPALAERVNDLGGGGPGAGAGAGAGAGVGVTTAGRGVALMCRAVTLLRTVPEYQPGAKGSADIDGYAAVTEHYLLRRIYDTSSKPATRAALVTVLACLVAQRCDGGAGSASACTSALRTIRKTHMVGLSRLLDRDAPPDSPAQCVGTGAAAGASASTSAKSAPPEIRAAVMDLLGEVYLAAGKDGARVTALLSADGAAASKGRTTLALSKTASTAVDKAVVAYAKKREGELAKMKAAAAKAGKGVGAVVQATAGAALALASASTFHGGASAVTDGGMGGGLDVDNLISEMHGHIEDMALGIRMPKEVLNYTGSPVPKGRSKQPASAPAPPPPMLSPDAPEPELFKQFAEESAGKGRKGASKSSPGMPTVPEILQGITSSKGSKPAPSASSSSSSCDPYLGPLHKHDIPAGVKEEQYEHVLNGKQVVACINHLREALLSGLQSIEVRTAITSLTTVYTLLFTPMDVQDPFNGNVTAGSASLNTTVSGGSNAGGMVLTAGAESTFKALGNPLVSIMGVTLRGCATWVKREWDGAGPGMPKACSWGELMDLLQQMFLLVDGIFATTNTRVEEIAISVQVPELQSLCTGFMCIGNVAQLFQDREEVQVVQGQEATGVTPARVKAVRKMMTETGRRVGFRARRDFAAIMYIDLLGAVAKWSPSLGSVMPRPPLRDRALRMATVLLRRIPSFEWKYSGVKNRLLGAGSAGSQSVCQLTPVMQAYKAVLDEPAVAIRARRLLAAEAAAAGIPGGAASLASSPNMSLPPSAALPGLVPQVLDDTGDHAVREAIMALLASFASMVMQHGLALDTPLRQAGASHDHLPAGPLIVPESTPHELAVRTNTGGKGSFLRALYHAHLTAMAKNQGVATLAEVKAITYERQGGLAMAAELQAASRAGSLSMTSGLSTPAKTPGKSRLGQAGVGGKAGEDSSWTPASSTLEKARMRVFAHMKAAAETRIHMPFDSSAAQAVKDAEATAQGQVAKLEQERKEKRLAKTAAGGGVGFTPGSTHGSMTSLGSFSSTTSSIGGLSMTTGGLRSVKEVEEDEEDGEGEGRVVQRALAMPERSPIQAAPRGAGIIPSTPSGPKGGLGLGMGSRGVGLVGMSGRLPSAGMAQGEEDDFGSAPTPAVFKATAQGSMFSPSGPSRIPKMQLKTPAKGSSTASASALGGHRVAPPAVPAMAPMPTPGKLDLRDLASTAAYTAASTATLSAAPPAPSGYYNPLSASTSNPLGASQSMASSLASSRMMPSTGDVAKAFAASAAADETRYPVPVLYPPQPTATSASQYLPADIKDRLMAILVQCMDDKIPTGAIKLKVDEIGDLALEVCRPLDGPLVTAIGTANRGGPCELAKPDFCKICPFSATIMSSLGVADASDYAQPFPKFNAKAKVVVTSFSRWAKAGGGRTRHGARLPFTLVCDAVAERMGVAEKAAQAAAKATVTATSMGMSMSMAGTTMGATTAPDAAAGAARRLSAGVGPQSRRVSGQGMQGTAGGGGGLAAASASIGNMPVAGQPAKANVVLPPGLGVAPTSLHM